MMEKSELTDLLNQIITRLTRIETKLHKLCEHLNANVTSNVSYPPFGDDEFTGL